MQENLRNTDDFLLFRYETLINFFWLLVFRHEERETQFLLADCSYIVLQSTPSWLLGPESKSQLASPRVKTQLTAFFKNHQNSQPIASGSDVFHIPFPIWGFYYDICDCHILRARAWTPALRAEQFKHFLTLFCRMTKEYWPNVY